MKRLLAIQRLGIVPYGLCLKTQEKLAALRKSGEAIDSLMALQHFPVYTVGKRQTVHNILSSEAELKSLNAEVFHVKRGGDVTFHGPGQLVLYPILDLRRLKLGARKYVEGLEEAMIRTAALYDVKAVGQVPGRTGVWVEDRKIGAVGVQISAGVTTHGLAFNVNPELNYFSHIVPCGIPDKTVTSLQKECGNGVRLSLDIVMEQLIQHFMEIYGFTEFKE